MVGDAFAMIYREAAPAFAFGGLEAFEEVEERERGGRIGLVRGLDGGQDSLGRPRLG